MRKAENTLSKQGHDCKKPETAGQWILCHFLLLVGIGLALLFSVLHPKVFSSFGITSILSPASIQGIIALGLMMVKRHGGTGRMVLEFTWLKLTKVNNSGLPQEGILR